MYKILAPLAVSLLLTGVIAQPASAATTAIFFYDGATGGTLLESDAVSTHAKTVCYTLAGANQNRTSYIVNGSPSTWYVFNNATCSSDPGTIYPNSRGPMTGVWNNSITSYFRAT